MVSKYPRAQNFLRVYSLHIYQGNARILGRTRGISRFGNGEIEANHLVPVVDSLIARLNERRSSNWDAPPSPDQYTKEFGAVDYISVAPMDSTTAVGVVLGPDVTEPLVAEQVEPAVKVTPTFQQAPMLGVSASTNERGLSFLLWKRTSHEAKGVVIGAPAAPVFGERGPF